MNEDGFQSIGIILICFILALNFTIAARDYLSRRALMDIPNHRSLHKAPVPRGGGWAILAVLLPGMLLASKAQALAHMGIIAGTALLALISWYDDYKNAGIFVRLGVHILAACLGSLAFTAQQTLFGGALPFWLDRTLMILAWVWFVNLFNFMDGIDGITGTETISLATGVCLVMTAANIEASFASTLTLLLTGACLGFLALNWHPAKIFLGDIGSVPLGFLAGYILLVLATHGHPVAALILPLYYLADGGLTLVKRVLRGEKFWQAHRQHFYQQAAQAAGRHDRVVYWIIGVNILLVGCAVASTAWPWPSLGAAALIVAFLLWKMHKAS